MNCPYCGYHFKVLASNGVLASDTIAPILCESCAQIGLFIDGTVRQATPQELIWIEKSPAFKDVIEPAQQAIHRERKKRNAQFN